VRGQVCLPCKQNTGLGGAARPGVHGSHFSPGQAQVGQGGAEQTDPTPRGSPELELLQNASLGTLPGRQQLGRRRGCAGEAPLGPTASSVEPCGSNSGNTRPASYKQEGSSGMQTSRMRPQPRGDTLASAWEALWRPYRISASIKGTILVLCESGSIRGTILVLLRSGSTEGVGS